MNKLLTIILSLFLTSNCLGQNEIITIEDLWNTNKFHPNYIRGFNSMQDGEHYTRLETNNDNQEIIKYKFNNGKKVKTLFSSNRFEIPKFNKYIFSNDERKILLEVETEKIYRYSSKSIYYIYDIFTEKISKLYNKKVQNASFSDDGKNIAYIFNNNIYIKNLSTQKTKQITFDGKYNSIINGVSDWVYEEEFGLVRAYEWSPDGKKIAYYKFDETYVNEFSMDIFKQNLYPTQNKFKYPKAGENNSIVKIYVYDLEKDISNYVYTEKDYEYIPRIKWTRDPNKFVIFGMNRLQNELDFVIVNALDAKNNILFTEKDQCYIDIHDNLTFLPDNNFIWTSEKDGYNHIYLRDFNGSESQLTEGNWEVTKFHGINSDKMELYYSSTEDGSTNRSLFVINLENGNKKRLSKNIGTNKTYFSKGLKYYLNSFSTADSAPIYTLNDSNGKTINLLEDNNNFNEKIKKLNLSKKEFLTIKTEHDELNAWMIKPPNFDSNKKYPLFMFVYGGPGSQQVKNEYGGINYFWHQLLAQKGYVIVCVDNRGTGGKGASFKKITYKQLGKYELIDQKHAAKYFGNLEYIDQNRIGIQGWSYGGYISSLAITKGADIFKLAIAVAPVTNWRFYDNIYTERYMQKPENNSSGYDDNSPIKYVDKLKGKYLLIHGSADDNVHIQNTYEMTSALIKANKQFDLFIYPDKNHSIYGGKSRYHLYNMMTNFITDNL